MTSYREAVSTIKVGLRPDVRALVTSLVNEHPSRSREWKRWQHYYHAKHEVSLRCGWHAKPEDYDQRQFELAMGTFVEEADL